MEPRISREELEQLAKVHADPEFLSLWEQWLSSGVVTTQLIARYSRFVRKVARQAHARCGCQHLEVADLTQEGIIGLIRALTRWNPQRYPGAKFLTYAAYWVKQSIYRAIGDQEEAVRLPAHMQDLRPKLDRLHDRLTQRLKRAPSYGELARAAEIPVWKVYVLYAYQPVCLLGVLSDLGSLDFYSVLGENVSPAEPASEILAVESLSTEEFYLGLERVMRRLTAREREVIILSFGLEDGRVHSLLECALILTKRWKRKRGHPVTRELVRSLQVKALQKIREEVGIGK